MSFNAFRDTKPHQQFVFSAFIVLISFIGLQVVAMLVAMPFFGTARVFEIFSNQNLTDPDYITLLKYFQVVQSIGLFIIPSLVIAWLFSGQIFRYLQMDKPISFSTSLLVLILIFAMNPFINFTGSVNSEMHLPTWLAGIENWMRNAEDAAEKLTEAFLKVDTLAGLFFNLFMIAVIPAIGEELLFRGVFQKIFTQWTRNPHWGIWLSAALFSALHMQFYGFLPRMLLGGLFGYLLYWSGSLWLPVLAHFINNAGAVIALWLIDNGKINPAIEEFGAGLSNWYIAAVSLIFSFIIINSIKTPTNNRSEVNIS